MEKIDKILVPTDFSFCSEEALSYAVFLAKQLDARILLIHIVESSVYPMAFTVAPPFGAAWPQIGGKLSKMADSRKKGGVPIETHLLIGDPTTDIVEMAKSLECDLIIMGTHGRRGIAHVLMGSVAECVIRTSSIPVLTVKGRREAEAAQGKHEVNEWAKVAVNQG